MKIKYSITGALLLLVSAVTNHAATNTLCNFIPGAQPAQMMSYKDPRIATGTFPEGSAPALSITNGFPFIIDQVEALVTFDDTNLFGGTSFEFCIWRRDSFSGAMLGDPEFYQSYSSDEISITPAAGGRYLLSVSPPPYVWGTNRVVSLRTSPNSDGPFTKMALASAGITNYPSCGAQGLLAEIDTTGTNPVVKVSPSAIPAFRIVTRTVDSLLLGFTIENTQMVLRPPVAGTMLGASTNLGASFSFEPVPPLFDSIWTDMSSPSEFFTLRPDDTP